MFKILRNRRTQKRIFIFLACTIIPAFIFWGSASVIRQRGEKKYAGEMFGKKVTFDQYRSAFQIWRIQLFLQYGEQAHQVERTMDSNEAVWEQLIAAHEAERMGITVSDEDVAAALISFPFLQEDGIFQSKLYQIFLRYRVNMQARNFEAILREIIKIRKLFEQVTANVSISEQEIKTAYEEQFLRRKVYYLSVLLDDAKKEVSVDDAEIKDYYELNRETFLIPMQINLRYAGYALPADATDEQRDAITKQAERFSEAVTTDGFDAAAATAELPIQETGVFGLGEAIPSLNWIPQDFDALFSLEKGETSELITTPAGLYVFEGKEKETDVTPSFKDIKERVKEKVVTERAKEIMKKRVEMIEGMIARAQKEKPGISLPEIAQKNLLPLKTSDFFSPAEAIPGTDYSAALSRRAFALKPDEISEPIETKNGYYILSLAEHEPFDQKEFEKVRDRLKEVLLQRKKGETFDAYFRQVKQQAAIQDFVEPQQETSTESNT